MSSKAPVLNASRLLTATLGNLGTGADDEDISSYTKSNEFVVCAQLDEQSGPWNGHTYRLRWRNVTDSGSFADLASTGQIKWGTNTDLTNAGSYTPKRCAADPGGTWQNGREVEGAATSPSIDLADEYYTEICWAVSAADAHDGDQYEFEVYDVGAGAAIGTCAAQITMAAGAVDYPRYPLVPDPPFAFAGVAPPLGRGLVAQVGQALASGVQAILGAGIVVPTEASIGYFFDPTTGFEWADDGDARWQDT